MNCSHCHHWNPEDEPRCRLCGRKLHPSGNDTTSEWALHAIKGNLAAVPQSARSVRETQVANLAPQRALFPERPSSNVIPFDQLTSPARSGLRIESPRAPVPVAPKPAPARRSQFKREATRKTENQPELDFLPPSVSPRTLKTSVEAVVFCDAPVATLTHRSLAGAIDFSLIVIGYGMCLTSYSLIGGGFPVNRLGYLMFAGAFALLCLFYGLLWTLAKTETPGMRWTSLRLTNFDGFAPDPRQRALRYLATGLSFATCGFGLLWALVDEECLTWQDHISETFPTFHRPV